MKLTKKIMLFEDFATNAASDNTSATPVAPTTNTSVSLDATTTHDVSGETLRTEVLKDVDSILTRLSELSDNIKEGLDIHVGFNEYESLLEELVEHPSFHNIDEGLGDMLTNIKAFASNPIKFTKLKKNLKKYEKALVQQAINNVDFAKKKQASNDDGKDKKRAETLDAANKAKNQALKDTVDAIEARMKDLATSEPLKLYGNLKKNSAKIKASQIVLKAASGEEAKQLKLKIETLEDRISDDGKSLKDYAAQDGENGAQTQDTSIDGGAKGEGAKGAKGEAKPKVDTKKLDAAVTTAEDAKANLPEDANKQEKALAEVAVLTAKIAAAEAKDEDTKDLKIQLAAAQKNSKMKPKTQTSNNTGGGEELTEDQKARIKKEEDQKKERETELTAEMAKPEEERNQQKITGLEQGIAKNIQDIKDIKAEVPENLSINTEGTLVEASLNGLMAIDGDEDDYKYLKAQAKKLGVKVSVDKDPFGDGYDELNYSGDKAALLKLAKISGHDADITGGPDEGGYWITETEVVELPKKVKLYEGMSVADKFKALM